MKNVLILCTGNSCRSQMAEAFLKSFDENINVASAGTNPASSVHAKAVQVMWEVGIDIADAYPKDVAKFLSDTFDYVITVCDHARETCPVFTGSVKNSLHIGFEDPAEATGSENQVLGVFRKVRDEISDRFHKFYQDRF